MFEGLSLLQILAKGGVATYILAIASVILVAISINRAYVLIWRLRNIRRDGNLILSYAKEKSVSELLSYSSILGGVIGELTKDILQNLEKSSSTDVVSSSELKQQDIVANLRSHIWVLGTIGNIAPFIGLFGTVIGIMRAFGGIAAKGYGGFGIVAAGIAEALIATAAGLGIAILAVILYNYFTNRIAEIQDYISLFSRRLIASFTSVQQ